MGLRINTNVQSLAAQRSLGNVKEEQGTNLEKMASGSRINKASDDAAGLAISEKLKANIRGSQQAKRNAGDGISMIQTAEGGLNEVSNILVRLRELSVQAASDTVGDQERQFSDLEFQNLVQEVDRIAGSTKFNGRDLLTGEGETADFQVGIMNDDFNDRISYRPQDSAATTDAIGIAGLSVGSKEGAQENLENIDAALNKINGNRASLGALQNRLQSTISNLDVKTENLSSANSRIRDTDIAQTSSELTKANILTSASTSVLAQANSSQNAALKLVG
ncbi:flagellin [Halobacteriovorax marinus]|uniref:Flagellin n=1 Tax=Halobacteriovorax marinus (strain ATCC BAA-682 / DSM 15412 / SJ) TaxID=862908 RepID=E1X265_HALMS|nr:flagellin [Halobacteriovorax marinus]ATH06457.1 flagellin [Halobacteriovorax marinus]CBW25021.1 putative flagellin FliC [Halobacteriovorax marinus SJ]